MKQQEKSQITRSRILDAAMREFGEQGYEGGTMNRICADGLNKGLIYHHFKGKDDLYLACLAESVTRLVDALKGNTVTPETYMNARITFFRSHPDESRIFFDGLLNPPPALREKIAGIFRPLNDLNETMYSRIIGRLVLRDGVTGETALRYLRMVQEMFNGYFSSPRFRKDSFEEKMEEHEKVLPKLLDYVLFGIAEGKKS